MADTPPETHVSEDTDGRWNHLVPNAALVAELLPRPGAPWAELAGFAGTFDGYYLYPPITLIQDALLEARSHFVRTGMLPEGGLSRHRSLLFLKQREDHFAGYGDLDADDLSFVHALVEAIRDEVRRRTSGERQPLDAPTSVGEIEDRLIDAFERLVFAYARWGGYRFHGWTRMDDTRNYFGPVIRSESDCTLRLAMELEREFPEAVHTEFPISKANFANYDPAVEPRQRVDLAITDLSGFLEDETSQDRFRALRHEAFVEVKWLTKGWRGGRFEMDARTRVGSVHADALKLANHLALGRCAVAATLVVDDEDYFTESAGGFQWPGGVWNLVVGPRTLVKYGLLDAR